MTQKGEFDTVLVVDFGAQYAQVIARRVRECHVYSEIVPCDEPAEAMLARRPAGIILSGGPKSVYAEHAPRVDPGIFEAGVPVLGICYGQQLMASQLGGEVARTGKAEFGKAAFVGRPDSVLLAGVPVEQTVWMSHNDAVVAPPPGFRVVGSTDASPAAAFEDPARGLYGVQFHPEVTHSRRGLDVLKNFLVATGARPTWTSHSVIEASVEAIRAQVGDAHVLCGLSGGVDSAVAAALVHEAVGEQLTCVFVDHGLLRAGEAEQVEEAFGAHSTARLVTVKAADRFLERLAGVTDPEEKRQRIGAEFIRVFEDAAREHAGDARFLVQGTLYPDVIESGHGHGAATIKSHHNVGGLPADLDFELVEPLRELFKDEVRRVGEELGLPADIVWRQPFPGPGLAVRIIGEGRGRHFDPRVIDAFLAEFDDALLRIYTDYEAALRAEAPKLAQAMQFLEHAARLVPVPEEVRVYDPVPHVITRRADLERAQLLVQSASRPALQGFLAAWSERLFAAAPRNVRWHLDVDPIEFS